MITGLQLQNYRSYSDASFEFDAGVNIIVGPNASGKTNLLEAVLVSARGASFRSKDAELIKDQADWARLDSRTNLDEVRTVKLQKRGEIAVKTFEINEKQLSRLSLDKQLAVVLFEPDHLQLLSGSPDLRRSWLDNLVEQVLPAYARLRKDYKRLLAQRNSLLKSKPDNLSKQLFVWNVRLAELGGQIAKQRNDLLTRCNQQVAKLYSEIAANKNSVSLNYVSKFPIKNYESALLSKLENSNDLEAMRGYTLYGPHRDDLRVIINDKPAEQTASRGEIRTLLLSLKLLELQITEKARGQKPMLLLDDVFSELDGKRRQALTKFVSNYQTFITTTDADLVVQHFTGFTKVIPL